ncbi:class I SAM-dependent methyltransferase [Terasakiella sp.]|uniref:class I SAM-dependent methyltransferase n=1 Tax=Terasakiella sp. TaxID=2034861 RepID=UPI003AA7C3C3
MTKQSHFWDRVAHKYAKRKVTNEDAYQKKLQQTRGYLNKDVEMLELACGTGTTAIHLAPDVRHIRAVDISLNMLEIAREKAEKAGVDNISFDCSDLDEMAVENQTYDVILAHNILHLLEEKAVAIHRIFKMLKPGGIFISSTACLGQGFLWLKVIVGVGSFFGFLPAVKFFRVDELKKDLTDAGFQIEEDWQPSKSQALFIIARKPQ